MFTNQPTALGAPTEEMRGGSIEKSKKISTDEGSVKEKKKKKKKKKVKKNNTGLNLQTMNPGGRFRRETRYNMV